MKQQCSIQQDLERNVRDDSCDVVMNKVDTILTKEIDKACPIVARKLKKWDPDKPRITVGLKNYIKKR